MSDDWNLPPGVTPADIDNQVDACEAYQDAQGFWQCERCGYQDWDEEPDECL